MPSCPKCGADIEPGAGNCSYCGSRVEQAVPPQPHYYRQPAQQYQPPSQQPYGPPAPHIKNWLVESILITVLCCMPLGIGGIINATRVDKLAAAGDITGAQRAASNARGFVIAGVILGFITIVFWVMAQVGIRR